MGLDSVEILMQVEDAFGIRIPDEEAEQIITVGDFHNSVWRNLNGRHLDRCHSQKLFYTLRTTISKNNKLRKEDFNLSDSPNDLFPVSDKIRKYRDFERQVGLTMPDLELVEPWSDILAWSSVGLIGGSLAIEIVLIIFGYSAWILLGTVISIFLVYAISELLDPWRTNINAPTIKEFTRQILALNYKFLSADVGTNRQEMESVINHIIADKAGLELEEINPEKKIGDDLGIS
jgi:acyl carrier protein